ncbi:MAG: mandelate racemase/muconate lactonizing enzyme family protein [Actinobacteria bacterium]|nr:mandelate racemase/muconate lactonizing enzyme family protein [Actinomycetota bacterium]
MKVSAVETVRVAARPEYLWVLVETDVGIVGTGETMPRVDAIERIVHGILAPLLIGHDPAPEAFWHRAFQAIAYHGYAGAELRALSALDIALWDIAGQLAGLPVYRLLGGPCRDRVPVYNTCVSHGEIRDHERFRTEPAALARELADVGYPAMKIWPFDDYSDATHGARITRAELAEACDIFAAIRDEVADDIEVALEGHSCWNLPAAIRIAHALEEFRPMWLEDMLHVGDPDAWAQLRAATSIPICGSERAFTRYGMRPYLDAHAVDIVKQDLAWTGGFTEFMKIAALAAAHELPIAPHNCHGPVAAMATLHAAASLPNLYLMETVRSFVEGFFAELVDVPPVIDCGSMTLPERPGLGLRLRDDVLSAAKRVRSDASDVGVSGWSGGDPWADALGDRV